MNNLCSKEIKRRRHKTSPKREIVIAALSNFQHYITAEELWLSICAEHKRFPIGTVYVSLNWMNRHGMVLLKSGDGRMRKYLFQGTNSVHVKS